MICYDFVARLGRSAQVSQAPNQHALFVSKSKLSKSKQTLPFCSLLPYSVFFWLQAPKLSIFYFNVKVGVFLV
jgi:hypothetical protein